MNIHLLKANDVPKRLNISRSQAFVLMRYGDIPTFRFGCCGREPPVNHETFIEINITDISKNLPTVAAASKSSLETPSEKGDLYV